MEEIIPRLFVGSDKDAPIAKSRGFAICAMCKSGPDSYKSLTGHEGHAAPKGKDYYWYEKGNEGAANIIDADDPDWIHEECIYPALDFIHEHLLAGENVLCHCNAGISRSPTTVMMYLRTMGELPGNWHQSYSKMKTLYEPFDPKHGIKVFSQQHWAFLNNKLRGE